MKILFYLFYFYFLSTFLLCQDCEGIDSLSECLKQKCCFANNTCFALNGNNYREFKKNFNSLKSENEKFKNVIFDHIKCNLDSFKCRQKFSNDIKENCFEVEKTVIVYKQLKKEKNNAIQLEFSLFDSFLDAIEKKFSVM